MTMFIIYKIGEYHPSFSL